MPGFKSFKRSRRDEGSDGEGSAVEPAKKAKTGTATVSAAEKDAEGNSFWPISSTRRVVVSEFKGKSMVSIREYYKDSNGDLKPGKKGISLPLEQWNAVLKVVPHVNGELAAHGHEVADVQAGPAAPTEAPAAKENRKKEKAKKANIEATSDEGEDSASD